MTEWFEDLFAKPTQIAGPTMQQIGGRQEPAGRKRKKGYKGPAKPVTDEDLQLSVAGKSILG